VVGNWQGSAGITTNPILVLFSILPENDDPYEEIDLIFGFSSKNWIILSL
jgi:hypothetical protein